jgi:hypothetical protein
MAVRNLLSTPAEAGAETGIPPLGRHGSGRA